MNLFKSRIKMIMFTKNRWPTEAITQNILINENHRRVVS